MKRIRALRTKASLFTGSYGTGQKCAWTGYDPDWQKGATVCSWAADSYVRSVYNNGNSGMVVIYYKSADYTDRVGCTKSGVAGNLAGTYKIRSHHWADSC